MREVKHRRIATGLTLREVAHRIGVSTGTVGAWETGRNFPRPKSVVKLARVLGMKSLELTKLMDPDLSSDRTPGR